MTKPMPDTSHLVAALVGAWLAAPLCLCLGVWLARRADERELVEAERAGYRRGRLSTYVGESQARGSDGGSEIVDLAEYAESHGHWRQA